MFDPSQTIVRSIFSALAIATMIAACDSDPVVSAGVDAGPLDAATRVDVTNANDGDAATRRDASSRDPRDGTLSIMPSGTVSIDSLAPQPTVFSARLPDGSPSAVSVSWETSPRELGTIDARTGVFTPSGAGGKLTISAQAGTLRAVVTVVVVARATLNGDPDFGKMPAGAGGVGGVGGDGAGSSLTDPRVRAALDDAPTEDASLKWLYPYDGTVWPRGLPAPLLQWSYGEHVPRAVKLTITVDDTFVSTLYLGPPSGLSQIDRLPIPQAVWRNALLSGRTMKVALTYAASDGSGGYRAHKAARELSWTVAPTTLRGIVYYNSYGTKLAENADGALGGNGRFGGATLAIEAGSFEPKLVAGSTSTDSSGCRVCHTVSGDGSTLIALRDDGWSPALYDLKNRKERIPTAAEKETFDGKFGWSALYPDGTVALGASGPPGINQGNRASLDVTGLYRVADASALTTRGLSEVVTQAATPSFANDGSKVVFNLYKGAGVPAAPGNGKSLFTMDVKRADANTFDFSNPTPIFTATGDKQLPGWPFFLPDNKGVVFELELAAGGYDEHLMTRLGARGELWWTDLQGKAHALDAANGKGYLASGSTGHGDDTTLQYEPTVAPIVAGGYAWVVFTSRRVYGNVATRDPFESDPRGHDLTPGNSKGPTTKKLWVTALNIPATPGTDPSHPAFYLPAQELFAGNSRGFWSLDVCKADGTQCSGGDECCGGYCTVVTEFPVCGSDRPKACVQEYDKCNVDADCCKDRGALSCIGGRCSTTILL